MNNIHRLESSELETRCIAKVLIETIPDTLASQGKWSSCAPTPKPKSLIVQFFPMPFNKLPLELLQQLCSHLHVVDYQRLRMSMQSNLSFLQIVTFAQLKRSAKELGNALEEMMILDLSWLDEDAFHYLEDGDNPRDFLRALKLKQFDPSTSNDYALHVACEFGHYDVVEELLRDSRVNPDRAIQTAAEHGYARIVQLLLGDSRVVGRVDGNLALVKAAEFGHLEVINVLLKDPRINADTDENHAIQIAVEHNQLEIVKVLLAQPVVDPSVDDNYAFFRAVQKNYTEIIKALLDDPRVDPSVDDNYAVQMAAETGNMELIQLLLKDTRVDPHAENNFAMKLAFENSHFDVVQVLLERTLIDDVGYFFAQDQKVDNSGIALLSAKSQIFDGLRFSVF